MRSEDGADGGLEVGDVGEREAGGLVGVAVGDGLEQHPVLAHVAGEVGQLVDDEAPDAGGEVVVADEDVLEDGIAFAGVAKFPARVKCALLSWMAWKDATTQAQSQGDTR